MSASVGVGMEAAVVEAQLAVGVVVIGAHLCKLRLASIHPIQAPGLVDRDGDLMCLEWRGYVDP